jgi:hypothetical protein
MYHSILGLPIILKNWVFYSKFDYSVRFLNSKNVVSLRKTVDECKSCWFANLFSNFLILRALRRKKVPKIRNFICCLSRLFLRILWKYPFFVFIWPLRLKLIYIHKNKVYSMFPSNFIREIKKLVFCGTVIFCSTYTCNARRFYSSVGKLCSLMG